MSEKKNKRFEEWEKKSVFKWAIQLFWINI